MPKKNIKTPARVSGSKAKEIFKDNGVKTRDGFQNFAMRTGVATPGGAGFRDNLISAGTYTFNLVTRNRILLEAMYRGSWLVGRIVDCFAEDMCKKGITVTTNDGAEKLSKYRVAMRRLRIWQSYEEAIKWGRLYGGCLGVYQIRGQNPADELDLESVGKGDFLGIVVYDRWQLNPVLGQLIESGPEMGLPAYYDIVLGSNINDPGNNKFGTGSENSSAQSMENTSTGAMRVHHTRCFRMGGHKLPFFQAITEMMWEESIIERVNDRLIQFDTASASSAGLIGRALLRTVKVDKFREVVAAGGDAYEGMIAFFENMRLFQSSEGLSLIDKEDESVQTTYTFAGLADINNQFAQQVSGAADIPLTRLFRQSPAGLQATGEGDMKGYHETINAKQESTMAGPLDVTNQLVWQSTFDEPLPEDFEFEFAPLEETQEKEKSEIATANVNAIVAAHQEGIIDTATAKKELKQQSAQTGLFTHITDEEIEEAENEEPPAPEQDPPQPNGSETGVNLGDPTIEKDDEDIGLKKGVPDSAWIRVKKFFAYDRGVEATMKEFAKGTLKSSSGKKVTSRKQALAIGYSEQGGDDKVSDSQYIKDWLSAQG